MPKGMEWMYLMPGFKTHAQGKQKTMQAAAQRRMREMKTKQQKEGEK